MSIARAFPPVFACLLVLSCSEGSPQQGPAKTPPRKPPEKLVAEGARMEKVATGYKFTEGPAADKNGDIWFSDIPNERTVFFDEETGKAEAVREKSGRANGMMFDKEGWLYICEGGNRRVTRVKGDKTEVLAEKYGDKKLNQPNDVDLDAKGGFYFTDPCYGDRKNMEMEIEGVYYVTPDRKVIRVVDDQVRPNGIILSIDGKILYVADNGASKMFAYDVQEDGTVKNGRLFADLSSGPDGISLDEFGNLYVTLPGDKEVAVYDPAGKKIEGIKIPEGPANCTFGGKDGRTLYVTAVTSLYRIRMNVRGK